MMRKLLALTLLSFACATAPPPEPEPVEAGGAYGLTVEEEAAILALEDRRQYDEEFFKTWVNHPNSLHRLRAALALARIAPHDFIDLDGDARHDGNELHAGVAELIHLTRDPVPEVREMAAFALGESGDDSAATTLFHVAGDSDARVAAETVEAISKLRPSTLLSNVGRYVWLTDKGVPEGVRARAIRYLFRFDSDDASQAAMGALGDESPHIRQEAAYTLMRRPLAEARAQLELLTTDANPLTRAYVVGALGKIGDAASMPRLVDALGDIHPWVRTNAAVAIRGVAEKARDTLKAEHLPRIFASLEDPDPGVRASTIETLGYYAVMNETARAKLLELTEAPSQWLRDLAVSAFFAHINEHIERETRGRRNGPRQVERYREMFEKRLSTWGLARTIEVAKLPVLSRAFLEHPEPSVRAAAITTMPDRRAENQLEELRAIIQNDPDVIVRAAAIERYGKTTNEDPQQWVTTLVEAVKREKSAPMNDARIAAIVAISEFESDGREPYLQTLIDDSDPVVRRVVAEQLAGKKRLELPRYAPLPIRRTAAEYEEIVRWSRQPHTATIHMATGKIELALLVQDAPMTTWNFAQLAKNGFYNNTSFMRVVPNFVIQGGDPRNDMNGGPGYAIRDEINLQKYTRGAVGMALSGPDTGGSQHFITHSPQPHLDGGYTIFARVYDGMSSVVDQTERGDRVERITIDERPPAGAEQIGSVTNVSLPLQIGPLTAPEILTRLPDYAERKMAYEPDADVLGMFANYVQPEDRVEVYMGTWCHDSQREVPKLLRILDDLATAGGVTIPASFVALDRTKQRPAEAIAGKSVSKVATVIYYRGDRELGRIEERPMGLFEDDLLAIAASE